MASLARPRSYSEPPRNMTQPRVLDSADVEQGVVLWLSTYPQTVSARQHRCHEGNTPVVSWNTNRPADLPLYNHPILVISRSAETIHFLALTTFGGKPICKHFKKHLALEPAPPHPLFLKGKQAYRTLTFEGGVPTNKPGYVKVSEVYRMQWQDAQPYWTKHSAAIKLDRPSFELVLAATKRMTGYEPEMQKIGETPSRRAQVLSGAGTNHVPMLNTETSGLANNTIVRSTALSPTEERSVSQARPLDGYTPCRESEPLLPIHRDSPPRVKHAAQIGFWTWLWLWLKQAFAKIVIHCFWSSYW